MVTIGKPAIILAVCGILAAPVAACGQHRGPTPQQKEEFRQRIGMSHEQAAKMETLHHQAFEEERELRDKMGKVSAELHTLYNQYNYDRVDAARLQKQLTDLFQQRLELHERLQEDTRKILTEQQYARLIAAVREFTAQHPRVHPRGPGGGPPPPPDHQ